MEGKTDGDRLTIASSILVWVANLSDRRGNEKLVMEWRGRPMGERLRSFVSGKHEGGEWKGDKS